MRISNSSLASGAVVASRRSCCLALDVLCSLKLLVYHRDVDALSDLICVVVGTKSDRSDEREVSAEEGPSSPLYVLATVCLLIVPSY